MRTFSLQALALVAWAAVSLAGSAVAEVRLGQLAGMPVAGVEASDTSPAKTDSLGSRLLLPLYRVDVAAGSETTLYAVRNESAQPVPIEIHYFETDRPQTPQRSETVTLAAKGMKTVNIRDVPDLMVDEDGFARGYVVIESTEGTSALQGDFFQVDLVDNFAQGDRLANLDPMSVHNDLCRRMTSRYGLGPPFDGAVFTIWLEADAPPTVDVPVLFYTVYSESGEPAFDAEIRADQVALSLTAQELLDVGPVSGPSFGVIEFEFNQTIGYISVTLSAAGKYSVGVEAACLDNTGF